MGIVKRGVHDVHDVKDYSVVQPVEEISGEKQEDIDMKPYKGYSPITRFAQEKPERKGPNMRIFGLIGAVLVIAILLVVIFLNKDNISSGGLGQQSLDMKIKNAQLEGDSAKINLEINPKEENIVGVKFIFETEEGIEEFTQNISINDSGEMEFTFKLSTSDLSSVKKISVVPILGILNQENTEEKEEIFGEVKDTYVPKPRDIQEVYTWNPAQNSTSATSPTTNTTTSENKNTEIKNNQTNVSNSSSVGSVSGGLVPPVISSTNNTRNITGITNQTTTMNYTNVTNNTIINPSDSTDSDDEEDNEEDETSAPISTTNTTLNNTTIVPVILLQNETQVREFIISSTSGSILSLCDKTKTLTIIKQESSWKVYCLTISNTYCNFVLNNSGSVIFQPQCTTTTGTLTTNTSSNTIDYQKICEDKGGVWVYYSDSSSGAAYCRLPIITNN